MSALRVLLILATAAAAVPVAVRVVWGPPAPAAEFELVADSARAADGNDAGTSLSRDLATLFDLPEVAVPPARLTAEPNALVAQVNVTSHRSATELADRLAAQGFAGTGWLVATGAVVARMSRAGRATLRLDPPAIVAAANVTPAIPFPPDDGWDHGAPDRDNVIIYVVVGLACAFLAMVVIPLCAFGVGRLMERRVVSFSDVFGPARDGDADSESVSFGEQHASEEIDETGEEGDETGEEADGDSRRSSSCPGPSNPLSLTISRNNSTRAGSLDSRASRGETARAAASPRPLDRPSPRVTFGP